VAVRIEQDKAGLRAGNPQFDPALFVAERLVREDDETEFFGIEIESGVLVADGNRSKFDGFDHGGRIREKGVRRNVVFIAMVLKVTVPKAEDARLLCRLTASSWYSEKSLGRGAGAISSLAHDSGEFRSAWGTGHLRRNRRAGFARNAVGGQG
jgi:hypothetical protein